MISVIIPAFNEQQSLPLVLESIRSHIPTSIKYEIVVVDNGSTDATADVARAHAVEQVCFASGTVAAARNFGAELASGRVLLFLDADVTLTSEWSRAIGETLDRLNANSRIVSGSWVSAPDHGTWVEQNWFRPLEELPHQHVNSGHLLITKVFFGVLGGFDSRLSSGEDADLSTRALAAGGRLEPDQRLKAIHHGFPKSTAAFFRRELWHGAGDVGFRPTLNSAPALAGLLFIFALVGAALVLVSGRSPPLAGGLLFLASITAAAVSMRMFRHAGLLQVVRNLPLASIYLCARGLAALGCVSKSRLWRTGRPQ